MSRRLISPGASNSYDLSLTRASATQTGAGTADALLPGAKKARTMEKKHIQYLNNTTYCHSKGGRCKVTSEGTCSHCGALVYPFEEREVKGGQKAVESPR